MLITMETDYAIRLLRGLADGDKKTVVDLSVSEQVPQPFAYKILKRLQKGGFVDIFRGADGGCRLKKELSDITLFSLMEAVEEDSYVMSCMRPDFDCHWCRAHGCETCMVHNNLYRLQNKINSELSSYSLQELMFDKGGK